MLTNQQLIDKAMSVYKPRNLAYDNTAGDVACALVCASGQVYLGVCIDIGSGIGFCAEHSAIAAMITAGETQIKQIVAVWGNRVVLPPCGRCRELMFQIDAANYANTTVILGENHAVPLKALLPHPYTEVWGEVDGKST